MQDFILEKYPGEVAIADDIAVHNPIEKEHDANLSSRTTAWTCFQLGQMPYQGNQDHILRQKEYILAQKRWRQSGPKGAAGHPGTPNLPWHSSLHGPFHPESVTMPEFLRNLLKKDTDFLWS